jgi:hypothetical protein
MSESRIKTWRKYDEPTPSYVYTDRDWVLKHRQELLQKFGECHIVAYHEQVLGYGATYDEAIENAAHNLPPDIEQIETMVIWIGQRLRIARVQSSNNDPN